MSMAVQPRASDVSTAEAVPSQLHWREAVLEGAELGLFLFAAVAVTALLEHPASAVRGTLASPALRRALCGLAMGAVAVALIRSPMGRRSGAHFNPAVTLAYLRLGRIAPGDAVLYVAAQFAGGLLGALLAGVVLGAAAGHPAVAWAATVPGPGGAAQAFAAELCISFATLLALLAISAAPRTEPLTPWCAGVLVATWIASESPLSGMSMNPARTFASALPANEFTGLWIYFVAPVAGMLLAAETCVRLGLRVRCAKLDRSATGRCHFRCGREEEKGR